VGAPIVVIPALWFLIGSGPWVDLCQSMCQRFRRHGIGNPKSTLPVDACGRPQTRGSSTVRFTWGCGAAVRAWTHQVFKMEIW